MKHLSILLLAVAAMGVLACSGDKVNYNVKGTGASQEGATVYLIDQISAAPIDSAVVAGGAFAMKGQADKDAFLAVSIDGLGWNFLFFNDGKPVTVNVADSTVTGSALNNKLTECDKANTKANAELSEFVSAFTSLPKEEQQARMAAWLPEYREVQLKYVDWYLGMIEENKDNLVPVAFVDQVPSMAGQDKFNELLASGAAYAEHPYVLNMKEKREAALAKAKAAEESKQAIIGQKFLDLEEADPQGKMHKLSEYVGKGKWVLVDFWASWCGPCKNEMPNVVAAYKKYHNKGFEIVGLSFDREKEPWVKAITEWEMPWIHLSDLKYWQSVASDVYNVNSIPDNLLIDPEGTVVARYLRGAALEEKLAEVLK
jgi:thiol-disulfide isomerase/thioredoxin